MDGIVLQVPIIGMAWEEFALLFITALVGGAFGTLQAFVFTGLVVFLGEGAIILERTIAGQTDAVPRTQTVSEGASRGPF